MLCEDYQRGPAQTHWHLWEATDPCGRGDHLRLQVPHRRGGQEDSLFVQGGWMQEVPELII